MGVSASGGVRRVAIRSFVLAAVAVSTVAGPVAHATSPAAPRPASVFSASRSLALEAARARLALFVADNPLPVSGAAPVPPSAACPLASPDIVTAAAAAVSAAAPLQPQIDPWVAGTTSSPELRPDSAAQGVVQGIPIVRCTTTRPADGSLTRPELFAIRLTGGVSFGDVARLHAIDPILRVGPAGIGGEMAGACLDTADTATCVVLWQSRNVLLGMTLEGPPAAVSTATAGSLFTDLVPDIVDTLAVVQRPPLPCTAETLRTDTGIALLAEPTCNDGWAVGVSVQCPAPPASSTTTTTINPPCEAIRDVFHVEGDGWQHNGSMDARCAETLAELGMTGVTALQFTPACNQNSPSLGGGAIRPGARGVRVTALQIALVNVGYDMPVDGRYGPLTQSAVVDFQIDNGLTVDGITGRQTRTALGI